MIETVAITGSTNADLAARLRCGEILPEGLWLVADRQTAGKGRQGRNWSDGEGNFMGSTVVRLNPGDPDPSSLSFVAGLATFEAVASCLGDPASLMLKWPNDLLLKRAKLAGILLERVGDIVIVGVGVNLAQAPDLPDRATMALADTGPAPDRDMFLARLAAAFAAEIGLWRRFGVAALLRRWQAAAHPVGTPLAVHPPGAGPVSGTFDGLESDGALRLRLADGSTRAIHAGDVTA